MKKNRVIAIIAAAVITASVATTVCFTCSAMSNSTPSAYAFTSEHVGIIDGMPCPFTECKSIEEAQKISGVNFAIPEYSQSRIFAYDNMIEIQIAKDEIHKITIRKSAGECDNTGLYGDYTLKKINMDECEVTLKTENGKIFAAYFTGEDGTISISCDTELKLSEVKVILQELIDLATSVK